MGTRARRANTSPVGRIDPTALQHSGPRSISMSSMNSRHVAPTPSSPVALTHIEQRARQWFLEAGRNNQRAKHSFGTERSLFYARKCTYIRRALQLDPQFEVIQVTSAEPWCAGQWLFGLRLRRQTLIGVHFPIMESDPLFAALAARGHRRSA